MRQKLKVAICVLSLVLFLASFVFLILHLIDSQNKTEYNEEDVLVVISPITITSTVEEVLSQKYTSVIKGTIKNVSNKDLTEIELHLSVSTPTLKLKDNLYLTNISITAGESYTIEETLATNGNFEVVDLVQANIQGYDTILLSNEGQSVNFDLWSGLILLCMIFFLAVSIIMGVKSTDSGRFATKIERKENNDIKKRALQEDVELLQLELEKEKIQSKIDTIKEGKEILCLSCGAKNKAKSQTCSKCGADLKG